jgi:hypothetical protein
LFICHVSVNHETLPIINKPKHPKKGEHKEEKGRSQIQEDKRTTQEGEAQKEHQLPEPPPIARGISNKERGGPLERTPSLKEPSPIATTCFKTEITHVTSLTPSAYKMRAEVKEEASNALCSSCDLDTLMKKLMKKPIRLLM